MRVTIRRLTRRLPHPAVSSVRVLIRVSRRGRVPRNFRPRRYVKVLTER